MSALFGAAELEAELLALFARGVEAPLPEREFDRLALAVFAHQFARNGPYAAYCRARRRTPETVRGWADVPAVPTNAFKHADLTTIPPEQVRVVYHTSGTTRGGELRGRHLLPDTRLYDASLEPNFRAHLLPDRDSIRVLVCGPTAKHFPHSSLGHMHSYVVERMGAPGSGVFWTEQGPRFPCLAAALAKAETQGESVALLGTAFGFVHFLDWLAEGGRTFRLPTGSRLMDTGGYKGRSREVPKAELYAAYGERLGIPLTHVVNEYGMTEMGSQFYDCVLRDTLGFAPASPPDSETSPPAPLRSGEGRLLGAVGGTGAVVSPFPLREGGRGVRPYRTPIYQSSLNELPAGQAPNPTGALERRKTPPPWVRTLVVDPETLASLPEGEVGLLRHFDLANLHTVAAIQTDDLGAWRGDGFELLGRVTGAEPRGCSLAVEDLRS